jgi:hypothetical protein
LYKTLAINSHSSHNFSIEVSSAKQLITFGSQLITNP